MLYKNIENTKSEPYFNNNLLIIYNLFCLGMIGTFLYIIYSRVYTTIYVDEPTNFKDNLRTNEAGFGKKLRTMEARFDFTGPYKNELSVFDDKTNLVYQSGLCRHKSFIWPT